MQKLRLACENWDAPFIITTAVQFLNPYIITGQHRLEKCIIWQML